MKRELIIVLDFGGQYNQLIARRVRECNVYCEIYSYKKDLEEIKAMNPRGIILTGGPNSCYEPGAPTCDKKLFQLGIPILGICYGAQLMICLRSAQSGLTSKGALVKWLWATIVSYKELSVLTRQAAETALMIFTTSMGFVKCSATICHQKNYRRKIEFSGRLQKIKGKFDQRGDIYAK